MMSSTDAIINSTDLQFTPLDGIRKICDSVRLGHSTGITKTLDWRLHQLKQLAYLLQENVPLLEEALTIDLGRPHPETHLVELDCTRKEVLSALANVKTWMKPKNVKTEVTWVIARPKIYHEPKGVVLIIGTWNYPVSLLIGPLIGAIAAGNSIVLKPSENCPATSNLLTKLIERYLDPENVRVINGAGEHCSRLIEEKFDHIFFTGSGTIGKIVAKKAAETLTPCTLEFGGKCPVIIFDDADLQVTARRILWGKIVNAGQTCVAPDYIIISPESEPKLIAALKNAFQEFYPDQNHPATLRTSDFSERQYSKIINERQFDRLEQCLEKTGGEIITLSSNDHKHELSFPVTLVRDFPSHDSLMQEELFGPILPITTCDFQSEDFIQRLQTLSSSSPLAIYVFTKTDANADFRKNSKSGQFVCNDLLVQFAIPGLPFGGIGPSGTGNYHGYHSFLTFSYERSSLNLPFWADFLLKTRYPPYTLSKHAFSQKLLAPRILGGKSDPRPPSMKSNKMNSLNRLLNTAPSAKVILGVRPIVFKVSTLILLVFWILGRQQSFATGSRGVLDAIKKKWMS